MFHHSMNYRCALVHGVAREVTDAEEKWSALEAIVDHLAPGSWTHARQPDRKELAATAVFAIGLAEASVKVRTGPPSEEEGDIAAGAAGPGSCRSIRFSVRRNHVRLCQLVTPCRDMS
ncbi:MAG TPA: pyridoxamine 5'-phosphate oxidase family protein [Propionibacteriaceae bacterium]